MIQESGVKIPFLHWTDRKWKNFGLNKNGIFGEIIDAFFGSARHDREMGIQNEQFGANWRNQERFAKHGLGWRIEDAGRYGISPLAAIGAQGVPGVPSSISGTSVHGRTNFSHALSDRKRFELEEKATDAEVKLKERLGLKALSELKLNELIARINLLKQGENLGIDDNQMDTGITDNTEGNASKVYNMLIGEKQRRQKSVSDASLVEWRTTRLEGENEGYYIFPALKSEDADTEVTLDRIKKIAADASKHMGKGQVRPPGRYHKGGFAVFQGGNVYRVRKGRIPAKFEMKHARQYTLRQKMKQVGKKRGVGKSSHKKYKHPIYDAYKGGD